MRNPAGLDTEPAADPIGERIIEQLALSESELRERVRDLETERATYRELLMASQDVARKLLIDRDRLRAQRDVLLDENRQLRGRDRV